MYPGVLTWSYTLHTVKCKHNWGVGVCIILVSLSSYKTESEQPSITLLASCLECDAADGLDCHFSRGDEDKTAQDLCPEVQGMLQVSKCIHGSSQGVRGLTVSLCSYRITTKITEMFCPHCGYKTLIKVAMVVEGEEGSIHYQPLSQKQFSHRGLRVRWLLSFNSLRKLVIFLSYMSPLFPQY